jgi:hypothetical protein
VDLLGMRVEHGDGVGPAQVAPPQLHGAIAAAGDAAAAVGIDPGHAEEAVAPLPPEPHGSPPVRLCLFVCLETERERERERRACVCVGVGVCGCGCVREDAPPDQGPLPLR